MTYGQKLPGHGTKEKRTTSHVLVKLVTVESRYIELGYFEVSLISNRCQRPGDWQWL